jgi:hypothetical protein
LENSIDLEKTNTQGNQVLEERSTYCPEEKQSKRKAKTTLEQKKNEFGLLPASLGQHTYITHFQALIFLKERSS